jgi:hypothetical protein
MGRNALLLLHPRMTVIPVSAVLLYVELVEVTVPRPDARERHPRHAVVFGGTRSPCQ